MVVGSHVWRALGSRWAALRCSRVAAVREGGLRAWETVDRPYFGEIWPSLM